MDAFFKKQEDMVREKRMRAIFQALTERREDLGMSDYHIAARSGVSQPTVYRILSGQNPNASFEKVLAIAEAMGMTLIVDAPLSVGDFRRYAASIKAHDVVNRTMATSALEGQNIDAKTIHEMQDSAKQRLLAGPAKDLWAE
jgi:transcriptional regulator with XRE-family HTH domain